MAESGNAVIAASNKCCWCCDWLGQNLDTQFMLPGTHGTMHAWDPPAVGVSVSVLERLEEALWEELHRAVSSAIARLDSRGHAAPTVSERVGADATTPWRSKSRCCHVCVLCLFPPHFIFSLCPQMMIVLYTPIPRRARRYCWVRCTGQFLGIYSGTLGHLGHLVTGRIRVTMGDIIPVASVRSCRYGQTSWDIPCARLL